MGELPRHILSANDFDPGHIRDIFVEAELFRSLAAQGTRDFTDLANRVLVSLFYEPSTRTRISFEMAMIRLGGKVLSTENAEIFSSAAKGETLGDTIRVLAGYDPDVIVLRHKQPGAAESASKKGRFARIINAGDGNNEHPTQALIDLFTVDQLAEEIGRELHVTFVGDLQDSRTVRSLAILLARLKKESIGRASVLHFVAPKELQVSDRVLATLRAHEMPYEEHSMLTPELAAQSDVVYMTRLQTERKNGGISLEHLSGKSYRLEIPLVQQMPPHARILHPLPRNEEIPEEVDGDKRAWYFPQAENGRFIRMALLKLMLAP